MITVIVDFLIFMSFYPAGLSLVIELMFNKVTEKCFSFISRMKKLLFEGWSATVGQQADHQISPP